MDRDGHTSAVDWWTLGILVYEMIVSERAIPRAGAVEHQGLSGLAADASLTIRSSPRRRSRERIGRRRSTIS